MNQQYDLFGAQEARGGIQPATVSAECRTIASRLPPAVRLGTSSWSFPGWKGLVYDKDASKSKLAREGLQAYARHPLFGVAGIDRTYYAPIAAGAFGSYAAATPDGFRFFVKAHRAVTTPFIASAPAKAKEPNRLFLNADYAQQNVIEPMLEGLGDKAGPLLFQFPPMLAGFIRDPVEFAARLDEFLAGLPKWHLYAVEIRHRKLYSEEYFAVLRKHGAQHCVTVHPGAPSVSQQGSQVPSDERALIVRWNLRPGRGYEEAKRLYEPFGALAEPDPANREAIASLCKLALSQRKEVYVVANNKAEGSAPLTLLELAKAIVSGS